jgi:drug/metabolite transporter (DMT)-like permease
VRIKMHARPPFLVIISSLRSLGLGGLYLSLRYLSVADATVLTFLTPLATAVAGCLLLKEGYSFTQAIAGGKSYALTSLVYGYLEASLVCSLLGVVLIARPPFLFDSIPAAIPGGHNLHETTPAQRLAGVG